MFYGRIGSARPTRREDAPSPAVASRPRLVCCSCLSTIVFLPRHGRVHHRNNSRARTALGHLGDGRDSWSGYTSPPVSLLRGVVRSIDSKTRRLRARGIPHGEATTAGGNCPY